MLVEKYFEALDELLVRVKGTQRENIEKAASLIVESVKNGGTVHVFDTGHIINSELINRAGGLVLMKQLKYTFSVEDPVRIKDREYPKHSQEGLAKYILDASHVLPGDVLIAGSVSGKSTVVVDLALAAKEMGVKVIVVTSIAYSSKVKSEHSSGKRLFEIGDVVIDNCAPVGDAMVEIEGLGAKALPASGISAAVIMWTMTASIIEKLMESGMVPSVMKSVNFPGGFEYYDKMQKDYEEKGY